MYKIGAIALISFTGAKVLQGDADREPLLSWKPKEKKNPYPMDYPVPNFGVDRDVQSSIDNLKNAEKKYGRWDLPKEDIQIENEIAREPLLSWKPKAPKSHPVDYFVPNFGVDEDIVST